jgi:hypothetical protein
MTIHVINSTTVMIARPDVIALVSTATRRLVAFNSLRRVKKLGTSIPLADAEFSIPSSG